MGDKKRYRPNVAAIVLSSSYPKKCEVLIAKRTDLNDVWQFPQGGIDKGESAQEALFRELKEEIGTDSVEIIAEYPEWISYDFPKKIAKKMHPYDGQEQRYYLVKLKSDAVINLHTKSPEFSHYKFVKIKEVFKTITHFKRPIYKKVLNHFQSKGYI